MSSVISMSGLPILDEIGHGLPSYFLIRARNEDEMAKKIWTVIEKTPKTKDVAIYHIGYRPDLIEVSDYPVVHSKQPKWHGVYPTGHHIILTENGIRAIFSPEMADKLCESRIGFMDQETYTRLQNFIEKGENEE